MGLFDFLKPKEDRKVLKSKEVNRPGFQQRYFEDAREAEAFDWNDQGILERNGEYITYGCYNYRMNQAVCRFAGKNKCEKVAKANGWVVNYFNDDVIIAMTNKDGDEIDWYILDDALSKI